MALSVCSTRDHDILPHCNTTTLGLAHEFCVGLHPTGPYFLDHTGNYTTRLGTAQMGVLNTFGADPDIVIASSGEGLHCSSRWRAAVL